MEKMYELVDRQNKNLATQSKDCTFKPKINSISSEILSQSDLFAIEDFLTRVETYRDNRQEKIKRMEQKFMMEKCTFKPQIHSNTEMASKYYERQLKKQQLKQLYSQEQSKHVRSEKGSNN